MIRDRYKIAVDIGAGCGLRQGDIFAVSPDDVDESRRLLRVVRQIKIVRNRPIFAPPKGGKLRAVPLPDSVAERLRAHARRYSPLSGTLPWATWDGEPRTVALYLHTAYGEPVKRTTPRSCSTPARASRPSLYLGHSGPGFTLRVYTHLLSTSKDRTRRAIDNALGPPPTDR